VPFYRAPKVDLRWTIEAKTGPFVKKGSGMPREMFQGGIMNFFEILFLIGIINYF
jgi:hypothetical protein